MLALFVKVPTTMYSIYERSAVLYNIFVVWRHQQRCAETDRENRDPQNTANPQKDCGSFADEKLRALHRRNLNK